MDINIRQLLKKIKETAIDAGHAAGKAGRDIWDQAKLGIRLAELNGKVEEQYMDLGKKLYSIHCGGEDADEGIDEGLMTLDGLMAEIGAVKDEIAKYSKCALICPNCGKSVKKSDIFCSACGTKLAEEEPCEEPETCEEPAAIEEPCEAPEAPDVCEAADICEAPEAEEAPKDNCED